MIRASVATMMVVLSLVCVVVLFTNPVDGKQKKSKESTNIQLEQKLQVMILLGGNKHDLLVI